MSLPFWQLMSVLVHTPPPTFVTPSNHAQVFIFFFFFPPYPWSVPFFYLMLYVFNCLFVLKLFSSAESPSYFNSLPPGCPLFIPAFSAFKGFYAITFLVFELLLAFPFPRSVPRPLTRLAVPQFFFCFFANLRDASSTKRSANWFPRTLLFSLPLIYPFLTFRSIFDSLPLFFFLRSVTVALLIFLYFLFLGPVSTFDFAHVLRPTFPAVSSLLIVFSQQITWQPDRRCIYCSYFLFIRNTLSKRCPCFAGGFFFLTDPFPPPPPFFFQVGFPLSLFLPRFFFFFFCTSYGVRRCVCRVIDFSGVIFPNHSGSPLGAFSTPYPSFSTIRPVTPASLWSFSL